MNRRPVLIAWCTLLALCALSLAGCGSARLGDATPAHPSRTATAARTATATADATATPTGVHVPAEGSAERAALLSAADEYLASADATARQCLATTSCALIDLQERPAPGGGRRFFALRRSGDAWLVVGVADAFVGRPAADAAGFSSLDARLLAAFRWDLARRQLARQARSAALAAAAGSAATTTGALSATWPRLARTTAHEWWASCSVVKAHVQMDPLIVYLRLDPASGWCVIDCGTGINPQEDPRFPREVAGSL